MDRPRDQDRLVGGLQGFQGEGTGLQRPLLVELHRDPLRTQDGGHAAVRDQPRPAQRQDLLQRLHVQMIDVLVGDHDRGHVGELVRLHPALQEGEEAGIEEELVAVLLEEEAGVEVLGDLHGVGFYFGEVGGPRSARA